MRQLASCARNLAYACWRRRHVYSGPRRPSRPAPPGRRAKAEAEDRSIPGLMQALERGEMPAAQQPDGLTVTMRP